MSRPSRALLGRRLAPSAGGLLPSGAFRLVAGTTLELLAPWRSSWLEVSSASLEGRPVRRLLEASPPPRSLAAARPTQTRGFSTSAAKGAKGKRSASQNRYLARQKRDPFVKSRQSTSYVSRSAFKLLQLDDRHSILRGAKSVIDLGASPGGWTQVAVERTSKRSTRSHNAAGAATNSQEEEVVVGRREKAGSSRGSTRVWALDRLPLDPVVVADGRATFLEGDFLEPEVQERLRISLEESLGWREGGDEAEERRSSAPPQVDVILSDMMANTSGNAIRDSEASQDLLSVALRFASKHLRPGGNLVLKYFESPEAQRMRRERLSKGFDKVVAEKVEASRKESKEMFWVCKGRRKEWNDSGTGEEEERQGGEDDEDSCR